MIATNLTPDPVGPQAPPTRAATSPVWMALRDTRGALLWTTGTASTVLDEEIRC